MSSKKNIMEIFNLMHQTNSNEVVFFEEPSVSLQAIVAVNDTTLGPAIATCRIKGYPEPYNAVRSALSMAYYNTFRSALLHKGFGGAGIALCGDPYKIKNEMYFRALGIFINKLHGKLNLVRSSNISHKDMLDVKRESDFLLGIDERYVKTGNSPVEALAKGMIEGLNAIVRKKFNSDSLNGLSFAIQGLGEVGANLVKILLKLNVKITITDIIYDKIKLIQDHSPNVKVVKPNEIYAEKCDIFICCAKNNIIGANEAQQLNCKVLTGSTNEILADTDVENILEQKNILYIPGFAINGGQIIQLDNEYKGKAPENVDFELVEIFQTLTNLLDLAEEQKKSVKTIAIQTAQNYINNVASIKKLK